MNNKLIAVLAVAVLVIAGVGVVVATTGDDNNSESENKGGFYAWDPTVLEVNSAYTNGSTPQIITTMATGLFKDIYKMDVPSIDGLTRADIPAEYLIQYDNYVTVNPDGSLDVKNYNHESDGKVKPNCSEHIDAVPDKFVIFQASYVDTIYRILCEEYDEVPGAATPKATAALWNKVAGVDAGIISQIENDFGIDVPADIAKYNLGELAVDKLETLSNAAESGVVVILSEYKIRGHADVEQRFTDIENALGNVTFLYTSTNGLDRIFSSIEMVGKVMGVPATDDIVDEMLLDIYVMQKAIKEKALDAAPEYYLETSSGKAAGTGNSSTYVLSQVLMMKNIAEHLTLMQGKLSDEQIVTEQPEFILFYKNDSRSMDEKMRVPA